MPKVIAFASLKGGTGKSSSSILLANCLSASGKKVLVIDMDLNNSCTFSYLENDQGKVQKNIAFALQSDDLSKHTLPTVTPGVDIIASSLYIVDLRTIATNRLKNLIPTLEGIYDVVIIDTSPTYDNLVLTAMSAADVIITPVMLTQFDFNTALFLRGKLSSETNDIEKWHLMYNGYDKRFENFEHSSQQDYVNLFEGTFTIILPTARLPWTTQVRRYIDRGEKIGTGKHHTKLRNAIINLASFVMDEEVNVEGAF